MSYSSAYITGLLLALMVSFNGLLSKATSAYFSNFIFNGIGLIFFALMGLLLRQKKPTALQESAPKDKSLNRKPSLLGLLLPGVLGAITILMSNVTVIELGVTIMVGISLLGQVITSLVIDSIGLLGKQKARITAKQIIGIGIMFIGVYLLL